MAALIFAGMSYPANAATPVVRMSQVNEALRRAGLPVNEFSQRSFAAGIEAGHYKTFDQLVNAMKWHKAQGRTIANFGVFASFDEPPILLRADGEVGNIRDDEIEIRDLNTNRELITRTFDLEPDTIVEPHIRRGSPVQVEYLPGSVRASRVLNLAPEGTEAFWGNVDCPTCPGS